MAAGPAADANPSKAVHQNKVRVSFRAVLIVSAALLLSSCGSSRTAHPVTTALTTPLTFTATAEIPTTTVAAPTSSPYIGPDHLPIETGPFLAAATTTRLGAIVHRIQCQQVTQLAYTSYAHLQVYVRGRSRALPGGIGMVDMVPSLGRHGISYSPSTCVYWLHTRAADGLIEVESPVLRRFTLGDLFAIWNQPLSSNRVAGARGPVTVAVDGRPWHGDPARIPLTEHTAIQLSVGRPVVPPQPVVWVGTGL